MDRNDKMFKQTVIIVLVLLCALSLLIAARDKPQRCTAIKLPISSPLPISLSGEERSEELQFKDYKPILSLVELPEGFRAVGGGDEYVIACTD